MRAEQLVARHDSSPYRAVAVVPEAEALVDAPETVPNGLAVEAQVARVDSRGPVLRPTQKF
jgi:hypothetical protein